MQTFKEKILLLFVVALLCLPSVAAADDNEIFGVVQEDLEPNILLIIDNSGSMSSEMEIEGDCYTECVDWECPGEMECVEERRICTGWQFGNSCWFGQWIWECINWECSEDLVCSEYEEDCDVVISNRMDVAKETTKNLIDQYAGENRFGIMTFHFDQGGYIPSYGGRYATVQVKDDFIRDENGEHKTGEEYEAAIQEYKTFLKNVVDGLVADGSTPLAETLFEAGRYFAGEASVFNSGSSTYPTSGNYPDTDAIEYWCRKNYIVLTSDGQPQRDHSIQGLSINGEALSVSNDYPNEGSDSYRYFYDANNPELHDVAALLFEKDINGYLENKQSITTYTIGFSEGVTEKAQELLQDTADRGSGAGNTPYVDDGGLFFYATEQQQLEQAFETIMYNINEKDTFFAAPTVPASAYNDAFSGDYVYVSMFQPRSGQSRWEGNLKKYSLNDENEVSSCDTQEPILGEAENIRPTARSCWSDTADGGQVTRGGAGAVLSNTEDVNRNVYTNNDEIYPLTASANEFAVGNSDLDPADFGVVTNGAMDTIINNIRMVGREWKLGDLNHSRPVITRYGEDETYIFVGSNDGMLYCFDDFDGSEKWAFVPKQQFPRLEEAYTGDHSYFMDGSPTIGITSAGDKILIIGERRGGNHYYAIDISTISLPSYLYAFETEGQSWMQPAFWTVATGENTLADVFIITGGYDDRYDDEDSFEDPLGNSIIFIDAESGDEVQRFDNSDEDSDVAGMNHSIVFASIADTVDDNADIASQIYAGDLGGNIFAFRDKNNPDSPGLDGVWQSMHLFSSVSSGQKIFHGSTFTQEYIEYWNEDEEYWGSVVGDYVYFGTGDRANPLDVETTNYFYCIKNDWHTSELTTEKTVGDYGSLKDPAVSDYDEEPVLLDVTENLIQDGDDEEIQLERERLNSFHNRGWYIELENSGEKVLSRPVLFDGVVYFTTYTPPEDIDEEYDPCGEFAGGGTARLYAVDYKTGAAVFPGFDGDPEELTKEDRSHVIDSSGMTSIPPSLTLVLRSDMAPVGNIGLEVVSLKSGIGIDMLYWKPE